MSQHPECPCCTCGKVELVWADRVAWADSTPEALADAVASCALDHSYDRGPTGVPWGLSAAEREAVLPVVARHLSTVRPDWEERTVDMTDEQRAAFCEALASALRACK